MAIVEFKQMVLHRTSRCSIIRGKQVNFEGMSAIEQALDQSSEQVLAFAIIKRINSIVT